jgi:hypothetical protein
MVTLANATISRNDPRGGNGGNGGNSPPCGGGNGGNGGAALGGGMSVSSGTLGSMTLTNSTISTNTVQGGNGGNTGSPPYGRGGDGGTALGGGISVSSGILDVTNCTVAANRAQNSSGGFGYGNGDPAIGQGGGVSNAAGTVNALNTLFGTNAADSAADFSGDFTGASHNLLRDGTGSNLVNGVNGNLVGSHNMPIDPMLGPLANNGGRTLTHALLPGSPAIDAGDNTGAPMWDQRGPHFYRIENGIIDIGAFEYRPPPQAEPLTEPLSSAVMGSRAHTSTTVSPPADLVRAPAQHAEQEKFAGARASRSEAASVALRTATHESEDAYFPGLGDALASVLAS